MKEIVRDSDHTTIFLGDESVDRLLTRKEPLPRVFRNGFGQCARSVATVEAVVSIPERSPISVIGSLNRAYDNDFRHNDTNSFAAFIAEDLAILRRRHAPPTGGRL